MAYANSELRSTNICQNEIIKIRSTERLYIIWPKDE